MNHWYSVLFSSLRIENWDEEYTVFQLASGKTHFLNAMGLQILVLLDQAPATLDTVCIKLAESFAVTNDARFRQQIASTLQRYEALGLIANARNAPL
ncbi:HPr-rel-A system PqqD family peptide chaperone [Nitrosomonas sp. ANs5]|uniref:HPr-rel-A system PqqD family peptide chaperone n=1 Tax=Nitrosomonas sp. ANs5 TaxID=3423941 RepID=UPI003D3262D4